MLLPCLLSILHRRAITTTRRACRGVTDDDERRVSVMQLELYMRCSSRSSLPRLRCVKACARDCPGSTRRRDVWADAARCSGGHFRSRSSRRVSHKRVDLVGEVIRRITELATTDAHRRACKVFRFSSVETESRASRGVDFASVVPVARATWPAGPLTRELGGVKGVADRVETVTRRDATRRTALALWDGSDGRRPRWFPRSQRRRHSGAANDLYRPATRSRSRSRASGAARCRR